MPLGTGVTRRRENIAKTRNVILGISFSEDERFNKHGILFPSLLAFFFSFYIELTVTETDNGIFFCFGDIRLRWSSA